MIACFTLSLDLLIYSNSQNAAIRCFDNNVDVEKMKVKTIL